MTKHQHILREISKFAAGLIAGDILFGVWGFSAHIFPMNFMGVIFTESMGIMLIIFDLILLGLLVHYGWREDFHAPTVQKKAFFIIIGIILGVVSILHLVRLLFGVQVDIGGWIAPFWLSWFGTIVAAFLSYESFHFAHSSK